MTHDQATLALGQLATNGRLSRHDQWQSRSRRRLVYHTKDARPLRHRELIQAHAAADYLAHTAPLNLCLPPAQQQQFTSPPAAQEVPSRFAFTPCFLGPDEAGQAILSLVLAMPQDDLQTVIAELDRFALRTLAGWMPLLAERMVKFIVLVPKQARADELARWLRRRPVLGRAAGVLQPVPVSVVQWPMLVR